MQPPQSVEEIKAGLETTEKGGVRQSIRNCLTVFQRDPLLSGAIAYNILTDRKDIIKPIGFHRESTALNDTDMKYLLLYKERGTGFLNANRAPLKKSENILVFYQKSPVYNPQFTYGKPYTRVHSRSGTSSNYGKFERQGSESNDGRRYPGNVLFVPTVSGGIHPTQKPVELCEYLIRTYTRPGELVADICAGSGTTAIAAINTERRFVCFETAPSFYAAASERIRAAQAVKSSGEKGV